MPRPRARATPCPAPPPGPRRYPLAGEVFGASLELLERCLLSPSVRCRQLAAAAPVAVRWWRMLSEGWTAARSLALGTVPVARGSDIRLAVCLAIGTPATLGDCQTIGGCVRCDSIPDTLAG